MRIHPRVASVDELARAFDSGGERVEVGGIRVAVRRLRQKFALTSSVADPVVETVRGVGYRIFA